MRSLRSDREHIEGGGGRGAGVRTAAATCAAVVVDKCVPASRRRRAARARRGWPSGWPWLASLGRAARPERTRVRRERNPLTRGLPRPGHAHAPETNCKAIQLSCISKPLSRIIVIASFSSRQRVQVPVAGSGWLPFVAAATVSVVVSAMARPHAHAHSSLEGPIVAFAAIAASPPAGLQGLRA